MKILSTVLLLLVGVAAAQVVPSGGGLPTSSIVGQITTSTGGPVKNGTLTFSLSQPAIASGTSTVVTQATACYTASSGNIVGVPDPLALPAVTTNTATGTLPSGTYYVQLYYVDATSHVSGLSPETTVVLSSTGKITVNAPILQPAAAIGYGIAISTTSGTETIQGSVTGWTQYQQATPLVAGSTPIVSNNSTCYVWFSDALIPTGTYYTVSLANKNGSLIAGFPQTWCTYGGATGTIDVSQGAPTGVCNTKGVFYPTPIFANPYSLTQSISGRLNLTGTLNLTGPLTSTNTLNFSTPGVFTNTQSNLSVTSQVGTTTFAGTGLPNETDAFTGVVTLPSGATTHQGNGVTGVCYSNAVSSPLGASANCVGVFGVAAANVNNSSAWGANFGASALAGTSGTLVMGNEVDLGLVATSAPTRFQGFFVTGAPLSGTMPAGPVMGTLNVFSNSASVYGAAFPAGSAQFPVTYWSARGTAPVGLMLDASCYTGACSSQSIQLGGNDGTNAHTATIKADSSGNVVLTSTGTGVGITYPSYSLATLQASADPNFTVAGCTDCKNVADNAAVAGAACVGGGQGAIARKQNNRWDCN
jgi:hypothetical protein